MIRCLGVEDLLQQSALERVAEELVSRRLPGSGWPYLCSSQAATEATCLALLAFASMKCDLPRGCIRELVGLQLPDGSWPAFVGDREGSWATAIAVITLRGLGMATDAQRRAISWLLRTRGREAHWLWRWKFKTADRHVLFNPDKYGWPWTPGASSWVIPTALAIIALNRAGTGAQDPQCERRIRIGIDMLRDRACRQGGWNAGNPVVYGVPLAPHLVTTAIALLALQDRQDDTIVNASLAWLREQARSCCSISGLAWSAITLSTFGNPDGEILRRIGERLESPCDIKNTATLALAVIASHLDDVGPNPLRV